MPELPEVESARLAIEKAGLGRVITDVDDTDTYECRPHAPGEIRAALVGRSLTGSFRQGKAMWCETSGTEDDPTPGPLLGIHLGMSGRVVISGADGSSVEGGDPPSGRYGLGADAPDRNPVWDRFTITYADGGTLRLFDKRRLGRVRLEPDLSGLGPDARLITAGELAARVGVGEAPIKARLLDQAVLAGVGNLLADETLWQAGIDPRRPAGSLTAAELATLHSALRAATESAIEKGGVHTGDLIPHRVRDGVCSRCGTPLQRATIGSRTTWWCPQDQH